LDIGLKPDAYASWIWSLDEIQMKFYLIPPEPHCVTLAFDILLMWILLCLLRTGYSNFRNSMVTERDRALPIVAGAREPLRRCEKRSSDAFNFEHP